MLWFIIDIVISFSTGYMDKGIIIMSRRKIARNYLKSWFALDIIAIIPFNWVFDKKLILLKQTVIFTLICCSLIETLMNLYFTIPLATSHF